MGPLLLALLLLASCGGVAGSDPDACDEPAGNARPVLTAPSILSMGLPGHSSFSDVDSADGGVVGAVIGTLASVPVAGAGEAQLAAPAHLSVPTDRVGFLVGDGTADAQSQFSGTLDSVAAAMAGLVAVVPNGVPDGSGGTPASTGFPPTSAVTVTVEDVGSPNAPTSRVFTLGMRAGALPQIQFSAGAGVAALGVATGGSVTVAVVNGPDALAGVHCCTAFNADAVEACVPATGSGSSTVTCAVPPVPAALVPAPGTPVVGSLRLRTHVGFFTNALQLQYAPAAAAVPALPAPLTPGAPGPAPGDGLGAGVPVLLSLTPTSAGLAGGAPLLLAARGLLAVPAGVAAACVFRVNSTRFGPLAVATPAVVGANGTSASCASPALPDAGLAEVQLCPGAGSSPAECVGGSARLLLRTPRRVTSVAPSAVWGRGPAGVALALTGTDFVASEGLACVFVALACPPTGPCYTHNRVLAAVASTPALWLSPTSARCVGALAPVPGSASSSVPLLALLDAAAGAPLDAVLLLVAAGEALDVVADAAVAGAPLVFAPVPTVTAAVLVSLRASGVGVVAAAGSGFAAAGAAALLCHYGSDVSQATVVNDTAALCVVAPVVLAALKALRLSLNAYELSPGVPVGPAPGVAFASGTGGDSVVGNGTHGNGSGNDSRWQFFSGVLARGSQLVAPEQGGATGGAGVGTGPAWLPLDAAECVAGDGSNGNSSGSTGSTGNSSVGGGGISPLLALAVSRVGVQVSHGPGVGPVSGGTVVTFFVSGLLPSELLRAGASNVSCAVFSLQAMEDAEAEAEGDSSAVAPPPLAVIPGVVAGAASATCTTPPDLPLGVMLLGLQSAGFTAPLVQFLVHPVPAVVTVAPIVTLSSGGGAVVVMGSGFVQAATLGCRFGTAPATDVAWVADDRVVCTAPPHPPALVALAVTTNGQQYFGAAQVEFVPVEEVRTVAPDHGPAAGGAVVTVTGTVFLAAEAYSCEFGEVAVPAIVTSAVSILCAAPPHALGPVSLRVLRRGVALPMDAAAAAVFTFTAPLVVSGVTPRSGVVTGGTMVAVTGSGFYAGRGAACVFGGGVVVDAVLRAADGVLLCVSPAWPTTGAASLEVTMNGREVSADGVQFHFALLPSVLAVFPSRGPERGGTQVLVFGSNFGSADALHCLFGRAAPVAATWVSTEVCSCVSPPGAVEVVSVEVSNNGVEFSGDSVAFTYHAMLLVHWVSPRVVPSSGGVEVTVRGSGLACGPEVTCRFGTLASPARAVVNSTSLVCLVPALAPGVVAVDVSCNRVDFTSSSVSVTVVQDVAVVSAAPKAGPVTGGTRVTVTGSGFGPGLACAFLPVQEAAAAAAATVVVAAGGPVAAPVVVGATILSDSQLVCVAPPAAAPGSATLQLTNNGLPVGGAALQFLYHEPSMVTSVAPVAVSEAGGDEVLVTGRGLAATALLQCTFGGVPALATTWMSDSLVLCVAPPHALGGVAVAVTTDGQLFSGPAPAAFLQYVQLAVTDGVAPVVAPLGGLPALRVRGASFSAAAQYQCEFGPGSGVRTVAVVASSGELVCSAPAQPAGAVEVRVWSGGVPVRVNTPAVLVYRVEAAASAAGGGVAPPAPSGGALPAHPSPSPAAAGVDPGSMAAQQAPALLCSQGQLQYCEAGATGGASASPTPSLLAAAAGAVDALFPVVWPDGGGGPSLGVSFHKAALAAVQPTPTPTPLAPGPAVPYGAAGARAEDVCMPVVAAVVVSAAPLSGPVEGGTVVEVGGAHFATADAYSCGFGEGHDREAPAAVLGPQALQCVAPPAPRGALGPQPLRVWHNGVPLSQPADLIFTYVGSRSSLPRPAWEGDVQPRESTSTAAPGAGDATSAVDADAADAALRLAAVDSFGVALVVPTPPAPNTLAEAAMYTETAAAAPVNTGLEAAGGLTVLGPNGGTCTWVALTSGPEVVPGGGAVPRRLLVCTDVDPNPVPLAPPVPSFPDANEAVPTPEPERPFLFAPEAWEVPARVPTAVELPPVADAELQRVLAVAPTTARVFGPSEVVLTGAHLDVAALAQAVCAFGATVVPLVVVSPTEARCAVPPASQAGAVPFAVSRGAGADTDADTAFAGLGLWVDPSVARLSFQYLPHLLLSAAVPALGPSTGGTTVTVTAAGLVALEAGVEYSCEFRVGASVHAVPLLVTAPEAGVCDTPALPPGLATLRLTDSHGGASRAIQFIVHLPTAADTTIGPATAEQYAPPDAPVEVTDQRAVELEAARAAAAAEFAAANPPFGTLPPVPDRDAPARELADGADGEVVTFVATVNSLAPGRGPTRGDTLVTVFGVDLAGARNALGYPLPDAAPRDASDADPGPGVLLPFCVFGAVEVPAAVVDAGPGAPAALSCVSPPVPQEGTVPVQVLFRRPHTPAHVVAAGEPQVFVYYLPPTVRKLAPRFGDVGGGARVTLTGAYFVHDRTTVRFGCGDGRHATVTPFLLAAGELVVLTPENPCGPGPALVHVEVSNNDQDFSSEQAVYQYDATMRVSSLLPLFGWDSGGTEVQVTGANFVNSPTLQCLFGAERFVPATWRSASLLTCVAPAITRTSTSSPLAVNLLLTSNGVDFVVGVLVFHYVKPMVVVSSSPPSGPDIGGTVVTVLGQQLDAPAAAFGYTLRCRFGAFPHQAAVRVSDTEVRCTTPAITVTEAYPVPVTVPLDLSANGLDFTSSGLTFTYTAPVVVLHVFPNYGPAIGGTNVWVTGRHFVSSSNLLCRFGAGSAPFSAAFVSPELVRCVAPAQPEAVQGARLAVVDVDITTNGADYTGSGVSFTYRATEAPAHCVPDFGPPEGGTVVYVRGANFANTTALTCRFGSAAASKGVWRSAGLVRCVSPPALGVEHQPQEVGVVVANNGLDFSPASAVFRYRLPADPEVRNPETFFFDDDVEVTSVYPVLGPQYGATVVTVTGRGFIASDDLFCRFGVDPAWIPAHWNSSTVITCVTGPQVAPGTVDVQVTNNALDFSLTASQFTFHPPVVVTELDPVRGLLPGGTWVVLTGSGFMDFAELNCIFGSTQVLAVYEAPTRIRCLSPPNPNGAAVVRVNVNLQDNARSSLPFLYDSQAHVAGVDPVSGPATGGTNVIVTGTGWDGSAYHYCLFGSLPETVATYVSATVVRCQSPRSAARTTGATVPVTVKQYSFYDASASVSTTAATFTFDAPVVVAEYVPQSGPTTGETVISVHGSGFVNRTTLVCRFGRWALVPGLFVSPELVVCVSPPLPANFTAIEANAATALGIASIQRSVPRDGAVLVPLEISNNNQDFTTMEALFFFFEPTEVVKAYPRLGPLAGGTDVVVSGSGFVNTSRLMCMFGDVPPFRGTFIDAGRVLCVSPPHVVQDQSLPVALPATRNAAGTLVTVRISCNNQQYTGNGTVFQYYGHPRLTSVWPSNGPASRVAKVVIQVGAPHPFSPTFQGLGGQEFTCRFNTSIVAAEVDAATGAWTCVPPPSVAGPVSLDVSVNGQQYTSSTLVFLYQDVVTDIYALPRTGPVYGGTTVVLFNVGAQFLTTESRCRFGNTTVPAFNVSRTGNTLSCLTPPVPAPVVVTLEVTDNDRQDFSFTGMRFVYEAKRAVSRLIPNRGPATGGTLIRMQGSVFSNYTEGIRCKFGAVVVPAVWHSWEEVLCTSPALPNPAAVTAPVVVDVEVTFNDQDYTTSGVKFEYRPEVLVFGVYPHHGPVVGGSRVLVFGQHFKDTGELYCLFGTDKAAQAVPVLRFINTSHIECVTPASLLPGVVNVTVSNNGVSPASQFSSTGFGGLSGNVRYTYDELVVVDAFYPPLGRASGNFSVRVLGRNFLPTLELKCRFGDVVVQGRWIDDGSILCIAPAYLPGRFPLEVSNNAQDFTGFGKPFLFVEDPRVSHIHPVSGPALTAGTVVTVTGSNFVNSSLLACRFENETLPATYVSPTQLQCSTRPHDYFLAYRNMELYANDLVNPTTGSRRLFPEAQAEPWVLSHAVDVDVTVNAQDYTASGVRFVFQQEPTVTRVFPTEGRDTSHTPMFVVGTGFVNTSALTCRIGNALVKATFLNPQLLLCMTPQQTVLEPQHGTWRTGRLRDGQHHSADVHRTRLDAPANLFVEVANNGVDFTHNRTVFTQLPPCPSGFYCPVRENVALYACPRGSYCPGLGNTNFTLCPRGTYQPLTSQSDCHRCPIGYMCPEEGLTVPRVCPAGFVCSVTGTETATQPCPEGHFCLEGTATASTTCGNPHKPSSKLYPRLSLAEQTVTQRPNRQGEGNQLILGARNTACWDNSTTDFGLHDYRDFPARFWMEAHQLPLSPNAPFVPRRGRYCLDDACVRLADERSLSVSDVAFDYNSQDFSLRRPVPCPPGMYCHPGTAVDVSNRMNYSTPQPCFESMYCPEGSESPRGMGDCPPGYHCPFGLRLPCPVGTYCPFEGAWDPRPCPPGRYSAQVSQKACITCPVGYICPGFGRVDPAVCPAGMICSVTGLETPNLVCPAGFYCSNGTVTSQPFRNDTTLRPYPCRPGTYCGKGVGYDRVRELNFLYAQPCTEGFYCEAGSTSPVGNGLCPRGFVCPKGTSAPVPTQPGKFSELLGTVSAATCLPGFYAPTIQTVKCYPCPAGTECENDGMSVVQVCTPGTYRSITAVDGAVCIGCPQGRWSKNYELRDVTQCTPCPPGTFCPIDGMVNPCSFDDFPQLYVPTDNNETIAECQAQGAGYYYGYLTPPIDSLRRGPFIRIVTVQSPTAECFTNPSPFGSIVYRRFKEFHGPLYSLLRGRLHQGPGATYQGYFGQGSLYIDFPSTPTFEPGNNCTSGWWLRNTTTGVDQWYPGNCEADYICQVSIRSEASPCSEGFVCENKTTSLTAQRLPCDGGYVCDFGTTPDVDLIAPLGKYKQLCPAGYVCVSGTGLSQQFRSPCPVGYFCPTGTSDAILGYMAGDAFNRFFRRDEADPFLTDPGNPYLFPPLSRLPRQISNHDLRCFGGINATLLQTDVPLVRARLGMGGGAAAGGAMVACVPHIIARGRGRSILCSLASHAYAVRCGVRRWTPKTGRTPPTPRYCQTSAARATTSGAWWRTR